MGSLLCRPHAQTRATNLYCNAFERADVWYNLFSSKQVVKIALRKCGSRRLVGCKKALNKRCRFLHKFSELRLQ